MDHPARAIVVAGDLLARLCDRDDAYRWICSSVVVNQHTLSDFRVQNGKRLDDLLAQLLGVLMRQGLVHRKRVAQDGMRVRANAGAASFRCKSGQPRALKDDHDEANTLRASATDLDARVIRMLDGGSRPGATVQVAADTESRAIVGVQATNSVSDLQAVADACVSGRQGLVVLLADRGEAVGDQVSG
jgi:hypothetical protein